MLIRKKNQIQVDRFSNLPALSSKYDFVQVSVYFNCLFCLRYLLLTLYFL